jgi:flagellin
VYKRQVLDTAKDAVAGGDVKGLVINGVTIGDITGIKKDDSDGKLVAAINAVKDQTGVEAYIDNRGNLNLRSLDGRGIKITADTGLDTAAGFSAGSIEDYGRLTLTRLDARDIIVTGTGALAGFSAGANVAEETINLRTIKGNFTADQASAIGAFANANVENYGKKIGAGVTTLRGAMAVMDIADSASKLLDKIRADIGSVQNQLVSTINNISVTQVNVKAAESQIRDVDFAAETANFQKHNILAQSGSYALSQANAVQQNVLKLLQ